MRSINIHHSSTLLVCTWSITWHESLHTPARTEQTCVAWYEDVGGSESERNLPKPGRPADGQSKKLFLNPSLYTATWEMNVKTFHTSGLNPSIPRAIPARLLQDGVRSCEAFLQVNGVTGRINDRIWWTFCEKRLLRQLFVRVRGTAVKGNVMEKREPSAQRTTLGCSVYL